MSYNKLLAGIISYSLLACAVCGCAAAPETTTESSKASSVSDSITYLDAADMFTKRDKQSDYASEDATEITLPIQRVPVTPRQSGFLIIRSPLPEPVPMFWVEA